MSRFALLVLSGGDSTEVTPVPIPNTEVKLCNADDTWRETARESKKLPEQIEEDCRMAVLFACAKIGSEADVGGLILNQEARGKLFLDHETC